MSGGVAVSHELGSLGEELTSLVGDALDLLDPGVIETHRVFAEELGVLVALLDASEHEEDLIRAPEWRGRFVHTREYGDLDASGEVLDLREHHELLVLGDVLASVRDDTRDRQEVILRLTQSGEVDRDDLLHPRRERVQWVLRQVDPEELLLPGEHLLAR